MKILINLRGKQSSKALVYDGLHSGKRHKYIFIRRRKRRMKRGSGEINSHN